MKARDAREGTELASARRLVVVVVATLVVPSHAARAQDSGQAPSHSADPPSAWLAYEPTFDHEVTTAPTHASVPIAPPEPRGHVAPIAAVDVGVRYGSGSRFAVVGALELGVGGVPKTRTRLGLGVWLGGDLASKGARSDSGLTLLGRAGLALAIAVGARNEESSFRPAWESSLAFTPAVVAGRLDGKGGSVGAGFALRYAAMCGALGAIVRVDLFPADPDEHVLTSLLLAIGPRLFHNVHDPCSG